MTAWIMPLQHNDEYPIHTKTSTALDELMLATTEDDLYRVLDTWQDVLLSENTLIVMCLTITHRHLNDDDEAANSLRRYLNLLIDARTHTFVYACKRFMQSDEAFFPPVLRSIELLSRSLALLGTTGDSSIRAELENQRAHNYMQLAEAEQEDASDAIEASINGYTAALTVFTPHNWPISYAQARVNRAIAYLRRSQGTPSENLEQASGDLDAALTVLTHENQPSTWAEAHMLRGLIAIDHAQFEQAVDHLEQALTVFSHEEDHYQWALIHMNRGYAHTKSSQGTPAQNLEQAISSYNRALEVFTQATMPDEWANTHMNRGLAYIERIDGDHAKNLEQALLDLNASLTVFTQETTPLPWATIEKHLGVIDAERASAGEQEHLRPAIEHYQAALTVFTREAAPLDYREILVSLAGLYGRAGDQQAAQQAFAEAHAVTQDLVRLAGQQTELTHQDSEVLAAPHAASLDTSPARITETVSAFLAITNWNELAHFLEMEERLLLSPETLKFLRDQIMEERQGGQGSQGGSDGRVEHMEMRLHLLEDAQEHGIGVAWQSAIDENLKAFEAIQLISASPSFASAQRLIEEQHEKFASIPVIALLYSSLAELRTSSDSSMAPLVEQSLHYLSEMRQGRISFSQPSQPQASGREEPAESTEPATSEQVFRQKASWQEREAGEGRASDSEQQESAFNIFSMFSPRDINLNDPLLMLILGEMQKLSREQLVAIMPMLNGMGDLMQTGRLDAMTETSSSMLEVIDRSTTPYLWASLHSSRAASLMDQRNRLPEVIAECDAALSILTRETTPSMWANTLLVRGCASMQTITTEDRDMHILDTAQHRQYAEQAIDDFNNALTFFTRERMPMQWAMASGSLGFAYLALEEVDGKTILHQEQARAEFEAALAVLKERGTPEQRATLYYQRAILYLQRRTGNRRDNLELALVDCQEALTAFTPPLSQEAAELRAIILTVRGLIFTERSEGQRHENIERAIDDFNTALTVSTRTRSPLEWAKVMLNRGNAYTVRIVGDRKENLEHALSDFDEAQKVFVSLNTSLELGYVYMNRGNCYRERIAGDPAQNQEKAFADFQAALAIFTGDRLCIQRASLLVNRGSLYVLRISDERQHNFEKAVADFSEALTIFSTTETPLDWAKTLINRAMAYRGLALSIGFQFRGIGVSAFASRLFSQQQNSIPDILAESQHLFDQSLADLNAALTVLSRESTPSEWATALRERAFTYAVLIKGYITGNKDEQVRQAIADFGEALTVLSPQNAPFEWAITLSSRAIMYRERVTDGHLDEAHFVFADLDAAETVFTRQVAPANYRRMQDIRASVYERLGNWQEAHMALQAAREVQRDLVASASSDLNRMDIIATFALIDTYVRDAQALLHLGKAYLPEVAVALEEGRAQSLRASLDLDTIVPARIADPTARERARAFLAARNRWRKYQNQLLEVIPTEGTIEREQRAQALQEAYDTFIQARNLIRQHDNPDFMTPVPTAETIAGALRTPDEAIVYLVAASALGNLIEGMAIIVTRDEGGRPQVRHLALPQLTEYMLYELMEIEPALPPKIIVTDALERLGAIGMNALAHTLLAADIQRVFLIPYGWLGIFPLPAVLISLDNSRRRHMSDLFEITYVPGARVAEVARARAQGRYRQRQLLLMAGNPKPLQREAKDLPFAEAEADTLRRIARRYEYPSAKICYLRPDEITRQRLLQALKEARYAHLALHGEYCADDPSRSRLLLAASDSHEQHSLYLRETLDGTIDLKGLRLLILSACETSIIDTRRAPDEVLGLAASFLQAGAAGVIASLWTVDDEATYLLMSQFAQLYLDPQSIWTPGQALARAQQWLRAEASNRVLKEYNPLPSPTASSLRGLRYSHTGVMANIRIKASQATDPDALPYADPFYWSAFVVTGC